MTPPSDPLEAFRWAMNHSGDAWWIVGAIAAGIAWTSKRLGDWRRRNALAISRSQLTPPRSTPGTVATAAGPPAAARAPAGPAYTAAPSYAASAYAAQPAYAAPPAAKPAAAPSSHRKLHREAAETQRAATPFARSVDVPAAPGGWSLGGAFSDPAHARTAIITAEVLGPPVALR